MEKSSFFNSINGDRKYKAEDFAAYFGSFISNGIFPNPADNLRVVSNDNMTVTLKTGKAWINGYFYVNDDDLILPIDTADGVLDRIDRVVIRLDYVNREIRAAVKKGTLASNPEPPSLQRDMDIYELCIAEIQVRKGAVSILQSDIIDTRLDLELCGVTNSLITVDVGIITEQFEEDFIEWFERIKGQLGEDPAGNLQNQIDALNENKVSVEDFNEHKEKKASLTELGHIYASDIETVWRKISVITLDVDATQLDIEIPVDLEEVRIIGTNLNKTATSPGSLQLRFNGDSGTNYNFSYMMNNFVSNESSKTQINFPNLLGRTSLSDSGQTIIEIKLKGANPMIFAESIASYIGTQVMRHIGYWSVKNTKVTTINLLSESNSIKSGSTFEVWGR